MIIEFIVTIIFAMAVYYFIDANYTDFSIKELLFKKKVDYNDFESKKNSIPIINNDNNNDVDYNTLLEQTLVRQQRGRPEQISREQSLQQDSSILTDIQTNTINQNTYKY